MEKQNNPFLNAEWLQIQREYLQAVADLYPGTAASGEKSGIQDIWKEALESWSRAVNEHYSEENRSIIDALIKQSRIFNSITEQFASLLNDMASVKESQQDWQELLVDHFENMKTMFDEYSKNSTGTQMPPGFMWTSPVDSWNQVMASMAILPNEIMQKLQTEGIDELARKFLTLPAMGINRNLNEKLQQTLVHWYDYQKHNNRYREVFTKLGKEALDKLQDKILDKGAKQEKISSLREIYNMWIDSNEEIFAEYVFKEDYSSLYADLVNSLIEFRKYNNILTDEMLAILNVPTSSGVKSLSERQHNMKNELRETARMQERTLDALEEIRKELGKLTGTKRQTRKVTKKKTKKKTKKADAGKKKTKKSSSPRTGNRKKTGKNRTGKKA